MKTLKLILLFLIASISAFAQFQVPDYVQNFTSTKPTVYAVDLGGGYQQVADSTAKADLSSDKRVVGMMVSYKDNGFWVTERYEGTDVLNTNWRNDVNWNRVVITDTLQYYLLATDIRQEISDSINSYNFPSYGTDGQVPFMNPAGTDLLYGGLTFKDDTFDLVGHLKVDSNLYVSTLIDTDVLNGLVTFNAVVTTSDILNETIANLDETAGIDLSESKKIALEANGNTLTRIDLDTTNVYFIDNTIASVDTVVNIDLANDSLVIRGKLISDYYLGQLYIDGDSTFAVTASVYKTVDKWNETGTWSYAENVTLTDSTITIGSTGFGYWNVSWSVSSTHTTGNSEFHASLFVNDVEITAMESERKIGTGGDKGNAGMATGKIILYPGDVAKLKIVSNNTGTVTITHANFNIERIN